MPTYRIKACVGWIANSLTDFGTIECDTEEDAAEGAWEIASEQLNVWLEEVTD